MSLGNKIRRVNYFLGKGDMQDYIFTFFVCKVHTKLEELLCVLEKDNKEDQRVYSKCRLQGQWL